MGVEIRLPNITGGSEKEQLQQLKSYLYQLSEQLQWAFDNLNTSSESSNGSYAVNQAPRAFAPSSGTSSADPQATFASIKSLIIKSAEIVDAYYEEINKRLEGIYVAQSDFGAYVEKTALEIEANSKSITQNYENVQVLIQDTKQEFGTTITNTKTELNNTIVSTKTELDATIGNTKTELSGTIDSAKTELNTTIEGAKTELSGTIESTKSELSGTISSSVDAAKSELNSNIAGAKAVLGSSIDQAAQNAEALIDAAKSEAQGYTDAAKSELDGKIDETASNLDGKIGDTNGRIDETDRTVGNLGDGLGVANGRIDGVDEDLQASKTNINSRIDTVTDSLSNAEKLRLAAEAALQGSIEDLEFNLAGLRQIVVGVTAYVKSGQLYSTDAGVPVYGIEIGQQVEGNGTCVFNKFARFTSEKLSFYDANANEVAYISDKKLYIGQAEITTSFKIGGLIDLVLANGDVITKWEGG